MFFFNSFALKGKSVQRVIFSFTPLVSPTGLNGRILLLFLCHLAFRFRDGNAPGDIVSVVARRTRDRTALDVVSSLRQSAAERNAPERGGIKLVRRRFGRRCSSDDNSQTPFRFHASPGCCWPIRRVWREVRARDAHRRAHGARGRVHQGAGGPGIQGKGD